MTPIAARVIIAKPYTRLGVEVISATRMMPAMAAPMAAPREEPREEPRLGHTVGKTGVGVLLVMVTGNQSNWA